MFDPLAVMLVIAYNQALIDRGKKTKTLPDIVSAQREEDPLNPNPYGDDDFATPQEDMERMDIIGQNGNDGLHYDDVEPDDNNNPNPQPTAKGGVRIK